MGTLTTGVFPLLLIFRGSGKGFGDPGGIPEDACGSPGCPICAAAALHLPDFRRPTGGRCLAGWEESKKERGGWAERTPLSLKF